MKDVFYDLNMPMESRHANDVKPMSLDDTKLDIGTMTEEEHGWTACYQQEVIVGVKFRPVSRDIDVLRELQRFHKQKLRGKLLLIWEELDSGEDGVGKCCQLLSMGFCILASYNCDCGLTKTMY